MNALFPAMYILAAAGFILAIKWLSSPVTARRGVIVGEIGMFLAVVGTLLRFEVVNYQLIFIAFLVGSAIGVPIAYYDADDGSATTNRHLARLRSISFGVDWHR